MTSKVAAILAKKVLKESADNRFGQEDPYFESVPATNLLGQQTTKKRKRAIPAGLSQNDARVLTKVKRRAYRLDLCLWNCCGIRFGWGSVIGLVPAFGDAVDLALALMVVASCGKIDGGLPASIRSQMIINVIFDFVIGLVPFIGDLMDALYKCNTKNAILLEKYLKEKALKNTGGGEHQLNEFDNGSDSDTAANRPHLPNRPSQNRTTSNSEPTRPQQARLKSGRSGRGTRGTERQTRPRDLEMGR